MLEDLSIGTTVELSHLTVASVPEYVGASKRTLSPGLTSISNT